ncbi:MAG TPA: succinylglutamate desuccinylase/aspartoacylase family protein [Methanobacteriaceae archaeon]|nr:succinylglutamate desuccinylase/aspartoacylase family protein [Methanobacteriaceae archaeon]
MNLEVTIISTKTGGLIEENEVLMELLPPGRITETLIEKAKEGTPLLKFGKGSPRIMLISGIHGNELPPQIAVIKLANILNKLELTGTIYLTPFAIPKVTMDNLRRFDGFDMNRRASKNGSPPNIILNLLKALKIDALADFHSTQKRSNPGVESVFCSKTPCYESYKIAKHITDKTSSKIICQKKAGTLYTGALEDESNIAGVPAVTCEVVSRNGWVDPGSPERSYNQMVAFLDYFGFKLL